MGLVYHVYRVGAERQRPPAVARRSYRVWALWGSVLVDSRDGAKDCGDLRQEQLSRHGASRFRHVTAVILLTRRADSPMHLPRMPDRLLVSPVPCSLFAPGGQCREPENGPLGVGRE